MDLNYLKYKNKYIRYLIKVIFIILYNIVNIL